MCDFDAAPPALPACGQRAAREHALPAEPAKDDLQLVEPGAPQHCCVLGARLRVEHAAQALRLGGDLGVLEALASLPVTIEITEQSLFAAARAANLLEQHERPARLERIVQPPGHPQ